MSFRHVGQKRKKEGHPGERSIPAKARCRLERQREAAEARRAARWGAKWPL